MTPTAKKSSKLFRKYFIYYILVLCIPVIITSMGVAYFSYEQNEKQMSEYADSIISLIAVSFDDTFNQIYAVNELIVNDDSLKHVYREDDNHYVLYEYQNHLKNIKTVVPFLENIIMIDTENSSEYIVSSKGTYLPSFFYDTFYKFDMDIQVIAENKTGYNLTGGTVDNQRLIAYVLPGAYSKVSNVYIIPQENFDAILRQNNLMHSCVAITDANHNLLYSYNGNILDTGINFNELNENDKIAIGDDEYIVRKLSSKSTSLHYYIMTPLTDITSEVSSLIMIYAVCMLIILMVGMAFSYTLAKRVTQPIYNLSDMVQNEIEPSDTSADELGKIGHAISSMSNRLEEMQTFMDGTTDDIIYINLMKLLIGEFSSLDEINENLSPTNLVLRSNYYSVAVFDCDKPLVGENKMPGLSYRKIDGDNGERHVYLLNSFDTNYVYILIMSEAPVVNLEKLLLSLKSELFKELACDITIGYTEGNIYLNEISTAFYSSIFALDYKYVIGKNSILNCETFKAISTQNNESFDYKNYYKLLLCGKEEEIIAYISNYNIKLSSSGNCNIHEIKAKIFGIFNFLHDTFPIPVANYQKNISPLMNNYSTAEDFLNYICDVSVYICRNSRNNSSHDKFLLINRFINENFTNDNFSMQLVADEVQMSVSALSKYYKEVAGINISEAVNKLKLDMAKELLINTDLTVNEIVLKIGYYNTSSFIRKFKEYSSITPGKFREMHKL